VWYRALARNSTTNKFVEQWIFDDEQTDNHISPWDSLPSKRHAEWCSVYPKLAALVKPRARRGVYKPNALVEAPESMEIDATLAKDEDAEQECMARVLKRLLSNEAAQTFFFPVAPSEVEYYQTVREPITLEQILHRHEDEAYPCFHAFAQDVAHLISNSFYFNDTTSQEWIATCMMQKEMSECKDDMKRAGLGGLLTAPLAAISGAQQDDAMLVEARRRAGG